MANGNMRTAVKGKNRRTTAFTLIDVLVAMGVLGVVLLSLFASFTFGFGVVKMSREDVRATQILHERMELIRLYNWNQIHSPVYTPATFHESLGSNSNFFTGQIVVTNAHFDEAYNPNLEKVIVNVTWTNSGNKCTRSVSTLVSRYGLQRYIFDFK